MNVFSGAADRLQEPDWQSMFSDVLDIRSCREHWARLTTEMLARGIAAPVNQHSMLRLVMCYVIYDRAARDVAENGVIVKPRRGNIRAIPRVNLNFKVMRDAGADAERIESELGLAPRRRAAATQSETTPKPAARAANDYLPARVAR